MGNCVSVNKKKVVPKKQITLAIVGLDNAGKTTLSSVLLGEKPDPDLAPTVGFRNVKFTNSNCDVTVFDVGGGKNIRPIWKNYFAEVYGLMFVIDSTSQSRLKEARDVFKETLSNTKVAGKPVLILANKVDKEHMKETEIVRGLDIEKTVNSNNCPSKMVMVSALKGVGAKMDKEISEGLTWLLNEIKKSWETLSPKVQEDMAAQALAQEKEREERKARVKKQREEREKAEELERTARGLPKKAESDEEDFVDGNPFKALDLAQLEKKERMLKAEKHSKDKKLNVLDRGDGLRKSMGDPIIRRRSLDSSNTKRSLDDLDIIRSTNHSPEKLKAGPKMGLTSYDLEDSRATRGGNNSEVKLAALSLFGRNTRGQALPPLSQLPPESSDKKFRKKKKRLTDYNLPANSDDDTNNKENSSWNSGLFRHEPGLFSRESEVHELTPRMTKPKISKIVNTSKIDEEEESYSNQDTYYSRKLGRNSDFSRNHLTIKSSQFDSKLGKENSQKGYETFPRDLDREDSMYRRTLKHISPPSLKRFDEEKEGESSTERDDLEEVSDDNGDRFVSYQNRRNLNLAKQTKSNQIKSKKKLISREMDDDDDEEADGGYSQSSILKDTLRFPRSPRYDDDASSRDNDESPRDLHKEIRDVQQLYSSGLLNGHSSSQVKRGLSETPTKKSSDTKNKDDKFGKVDQSNRPETRRKKKRSIFRSNKLAPSDDDADSTVSDRLGSPRLVQQATKHDSLARLGNARSTQFHNNVPKEQDFSAKWGLAEELPVIEDDYTVRRIPNFDDSDADDIVF